MSGVKFGRQAGDWMLGEWTEWKISVTVQEGNLPRIEAPPLTPGRVASEGEESEEAERGGCVTFRESLVGGEREGLFERGIRVVRSSGGGLFLFRFVGWCEEGVGGLAVMLRGLFLNLECCRNVFVRADVRILMTSCTDCFLYCDPVTCSTH
jgi:hypothetical protein